MIMHSADEEVLHQAHRIAGMFNHIAPTYDLLNHLLSFGLDKRWRATALRAASPQPRDNWLDLAAGSGDMVFAGLKFAPASNWFAADPSIELLNGLKRKLPPGYTVPTILSRAEALPFPDHHFSGVTVAFGVRNFADTRRGLNEVARVLKPGGRLVILEFHPQAGGSWGGNPLVTLYLHHILPLIGAAVSGQYKAYRYLSESSRNFWTIERMVSELNSVGFSTVQYQSLFAKSVILTRAIK
ncbi:MAG TPA: ubiquinone/menaquinone biosynthesis methyltransferase [Bacteroidetes bacterium]|nr:ubiquinone/menaquinone biosynthesis C-methyltransferase UbiE [bacterium BMS3Bbin04]HDO66145.1 ubiquinone/menaquinone biosynthesis methyltransferase [Bacteroidota bacterium]HEX05270.1 ubiquinone/menaquinone biosynthesis methyltransferase [Bacteroidota bacterium]